MGRLRTANPHPFECVPYLEGIIHAKKCISEIWLIPLDAVNGVNKYCSAVEFLKSSALWAEGTPERAEHYFPESPWLRDIFREHSCPVWTQVFDDLLECERFQTEMSRRMKRLDRRHEFVAYDQAYKLVAIPMQQIIIGKAEKILEATLQRKSQDWFRFAMGRDQRDQMAEVHVELYGKVSAPPRDKTTATADPVPPNPKADKPTRLNTKFAGDLADPDTNNGEDSVFGPGKNLPPDAAAEANEAIAKVRQAVANTLSVEEQLVVQLKTEEELSLPEIDEQMGWNYGTAEKHWRKAKRKLGAKLSIDFQE